MSHNAGTPGQGASLIMDKLPKKLRLYLKDFPVEMDVGFALQKLNQGYTVAELIAKLESFKQGLSEFNPVNKDRGI